MLPLINNFHYFFRNVIQLTILKFKSLGCCILIFFVIINPNKTQEDKTWTEASQNTMCSSSASIPAYALNSRADLHKILGAHIAFDTIGLDQVQRPEQIKGYQCILFSSPLVQSEFPISIPKGGHADYLSPGPSTMPVWTKSSAYRPVSEST